MVTLSLLVASMAKEVNKLKKFVENEDEMMGQVAEAIAGFMDICNSVNAMNQDLVKVINNVSGADSSVSAETEEEWDEWLK